MEQQHEELIKVANAALALGDFFIPPKGTLLLWWPNPKERNAFTVVVDKGTTQLSQIDTVLAMLWDHKDTLTYDIHKHGGYRLNARDKFILLDFHRVDGTVPRFEDWAQASKQRMNTVDIANAAIKLGDLHAPPVGSVLELGWVLVEVISPIETTTPTSDPYVHAINVNTDVPYVVYLSSTDYTLLSIPEDAPPFEQWERAAL